LSHYLFIYEIGRWLVGSVFLFSGLIKLNDLGGFILKITTYLEILSFDLGRFFRLFLPYTLPLGLAICLLEVGLGTALLVRWHTAIVIGSLWALTTFFALLTGYIFWSKRMASCGCLGEFIILTPQQSFLKNIFLWALLASLYQGRLLGQPLPSTGQVLGLASVLCAGILLGWYGLTWLPLLDISPYKIGSSMVQHVRPPHHPSHHDRDSPASPAATRSPDSTYPINKTAWHLIKQTKQPAPLLVWDRQKDITPAILQGTWLLIVISQPIQLSDKLQQAWQHLLAGIGKEVKVLWLLPFENEKGDLPIPIASPALGWTQLELLRALLPSSMGLVWLQEGVVKGKWSYRSVAKAQAILQQQGLYSAPQAAQVAGTSHEPGT
jgi:hypothetical protein